MKDPIYLQKDFLIPPPVNRDQDNAKLAVADDHAHVILTQYKFLSLIAKSTRSIQAHDILQKHHEVTVYDDLQLLDQNNLLF